MHVCVCGGGLVMLFTLCSDFVNTHMSSLQLLISNKLWSDAITLVERLKDEEKCHSALFHCLLVSLAKVRVH